MARRYHIYKENELYQAAPYLKRLEGTHNYDNVLEKIESVAHLVEAAISKKFSILTFVGEISDEPLKMEVTFDTDRRGCQIGVTAEICGQKHTVLDSATCLYIGFDHFMDWVKSITAVTKGTELPEGVNVPIELWANTDTGKQFIESMEGLGFSYNRKSKYCYDAPFDARQCDEGRLLEYCDYIGHYRVTNSDEASYNDYCFRIRSYAKGAEPRFYVDNNYFFKKIKEWGFKYDEKFVAEWDDSYHRKPLHEYGMTSAEFLETMQNFIKFNTERIDKISEEHGGLTWRGIDFGIARGRFDKPDKFEKLPEAEQKRIEATIEAQKVVLKKETDEYFLNSKFGKIYKYLLEHGTVGLEEQQWGNEHRVTYKFDVTIDVPKKDSDSFEKKKITVNGCIWVSDRLRRSCWGDCSFYPEMFRMNLPMCYATDQGSSFVSWDEAKNAGSNLRYGGSCKMGKRDFSSISINPYWHDDRYVHTDEIERIEKVMFNIEADHEQYLIDCHYKKAEA